MQVFFQETIHNLKWFLVRTLFFMRICLSNKPVFLVSNIYIPLFSQPILKFFSQHGDSYYTTLGQCSVTLHNFHKCFSSFKMFKYLNICIAFFFSPLSSISHHLSLPFIYSLSDNFKSMRQCSFPTHLRLIFHVWVLRYCIWCLLTLDTWSKIILSYKLVTLTVVTLCSTLYMQGHNYTHCCLLLVLLLSDAYFTFFFPHYFPRDCNVIYQMIISTITLYSSSKVQCHPAIWCLISSAKA